MLDRLPLSLQQCLLLEWLSPDTVWVVARASGVLRRCVLESPRAFRAAEEEVLCKACIRWFRAHSVPLALWSTVDTREYGVFHECNGERHRDGDLPAAVFTNGTQVWYHHGKAHRENDLPAAVWADGAQVWYQNGVLHRDGDQPAYIGANGRREWYQHGQRHRDGDLPAVVHCTATRDHKEYWKHGVEQFHDSLPDDTG